jgi:hypothetical protein
MTKLGQKSTIVQKAPNETMAIGQQSEPIRRRMDFLVVPTPKPVTPPAKKLAHHTITRLSERVNHIDDPDQIAKTVGIITTLNTHLEDVRFEV